jgi:hypothetical protein
MSTNVFGSILHDARKLFAKGKKLMGKKLITIIPTDYDPFTPYT